MLCPKCNKPLIVVERNKIELDWCPECHGFWFDADEWRLLGVDKEQYDPYAQEAIKSDEQSRKCPICNKTMDKIDIDGILLDRCPVFHGVWFDQNELSRLVNKSNSKSKNVKTINFLGEVFDIKN